MPRASSNRFRMPSMLSEGNSSRSTTYSIKYLQAGVAIAETLFGIGLLDRHKSSLGVYRGVRGVADERAVGALSRGLGMSANETGLAMNAMALPSVMAVSLDLNKSSPGTAGPSGGLGRFYAGSQLWGPTEILGQGVEAMVACRRAVNGR